MEISFFKYFEKENFISFLNVLNYLDTLLMEVKVAVSLFGNDLVFTEE